jgi:hypothetical protein
MNQFLVKLELLDTRPNYPGTRVVKKVTNYPGTRVLDTRHWKHYIYQNNVLTKMELIRGSSINDVTF